MNINDYNSSFYANKKRHEVMCSCPLVYWYRQTPSKERGRGEHISRLKICYQSIAYTIKRKHSCSSSFLKICRFYRQGLCCNAFLAYCFHLSKASAKVRRFFNTAKIILHRMRNAPPPRRRRHATHVRGGLGCRRCGGSVATRSDTCDGSTLFHIVNEMLKYYHLLLKKVIV